jgi:leader peptidase (prepilin peptidase)/N-methyltransferase
MDAYLIGSAVAFGLLIGSFLNVVIYRLPREMDWVWVRSQCPACKKRIAWFDNFPLFSFVVLRGRCRHCRAAISWRYPLVEALTGVLLGLAMAHTLDLAGPPGVIWRSVGFAFMAVFLAGLVAATFIDFDHRILPDEITKTGMWVTPVTSLVFPWIVVSHFDVQDLGFSGVTDHAGGLIGSVLGLLVGAVLVWLVAVLGKWVFRKDAMGFGDVKFMGMIGGFLGPIPVLMTFFLGCLFGSVVGITIFLITRNRYMAFGPYLALGAIVMLFWGDRAIEIAIHDWPRFLSGLFR